MGKYPKAKVILTEAPNSRSWFYTFQKDTQFGLHQDIVKAEYHRLSNCPLPAHDEDVNDCAESLEKHSELIRASVQPRQLLEFRPELGWEPLCKFLNLPVPKAALPGAKAKSSVSAVVV